VVKLVGLDETNLDRYGRHFPHLVVKGGRNPEKDKFAAKTRDTYDAASHRPGEADLLLEMKKSPNRLIVNKIGAVRTESYFQKGTRVPFTE